MVLAVCTTKPVVSRVKGERGVADISFKRSRLGALKKVRNLLVVGTFNVRKFVRERRCERRRDRRRLLWEHSTVVFFVTKARQVDVIASGQGLPAFGAFVKEHVSTRWSSG